MKPTYTDFQEFGRDFAVEAARLGLPVERLTGRGKITLFCPSCNQTKPQRGRKHINGKACCAECATKKS